MPTVPIDPTARVLTAEQLARTIEAYRFRRIFHLHTVGHDEPDWWPRLAGPGRTLDQLRVIRGAVPPEAARPPPSGPVRVRILDVRCGVQPAEADDDFLLIDDEHAIRLVYDDHGRFAIAFPAPAAGLDRYRFIRDSAWAAGRP